MLKLEIFDEIISLFRLFRLVKVPFIVFVKVTCFLFPESSYSAAVFLYIRSTLNANRIYLVAFQDTISDVLEVN